MEMEIEEQNYSSYLNKHEEVLRNINDKLLERLKDERKGILSVIDTKKRIKENYSKVLEEKKEQKARKEEEKEKLKLKREETEKKRLNLNEKIQYQTALLEKLSSVESAIKVEEATLSSLKSRSEQNYIEKAQRYVQTQKEALGLKICATRRGTLIFTFTQINREDTSKEYLLELSINGDKYTLLKTLPPLENLQQIEDRLNDTGNFSGFLLYIRSRFCGNV